MESSEITSENVCGDISRNSNNSQHDNSRIVHEERLEKVVRKRNQKFEEIDLEGRRIVDIQYFIDSLKLIADHAPHMGCTLNNMKVVGEYMNGFSSEIKFKCNMCSETRTVTTVYDHADINSSAIMGVTTMGSGFTHLNHLISSIDIPMFSPSTYNRIQDELSDIWGEIALEEMARAAEEEKRIAMECGDVTTDEIPLITVVCDGVWAKRSYRSNYSSLSGAAAIVGYKTRKILYLAVSNKFGITCKKLPDDALYHKCYRNWSGSSSAMESDIIAEGFMKSLGMHGLIYSQMVADGDSSCYKKFLIAILTGK
ncbi:unnamed protein product [Phaedon cochleariae]|uniref:Mutator-like transposase domain-containing protein n=1 Tax=Phaedon cochleariae TaxID=80249 RepID=A0A9N9SCY1_PHACE|nr:unnamed protein product [Phaedon cochleariae]